MRSEAIGVFSTVASCLTVQDECIKSKSPSHLIWSPQLDFGRGNAGALLMRLWMPSCALMILIWTRVIMLVM